MQIITLIKKLPNLNPDEEKIFIEEITVTYLRGKRDAELKSANNVSLWTVDKDGYYCCLRCEKYALLDWAGSSIASDFCPHCGSKMKKVHKVKISGVRWKK